MADQRYTRNWNEDERDYGPGRGGARMRGERADAYRQRDYDDFRERDDYDMRGGRDESRGRGPNLRQPERPWEDDRDMRSRDREWQQDEGHAYGFVRHEQGRGARDEREDGGRGWSSGGERGRYGEGDRGRGDRMWSGGGGAGMSGRRNEMGGQMGGQQRGFGGDWGQGQGGQGQQRSGATGIPGQGPQMTGAGLRGKGPKGYSRGDDRIREDVCDRLSDDDDVDASNISVRVSNGEVTLDGHVASRWEKRAAEDCVEQCSGVKHVQNNLRVKEASSSNDAGSDEGASASGGQGGAGQQNQQANKARKDT